MSISVPEEPVYYYECSAGNFRLVAFLPKKHLAELAEAGKISPRALEEYPDGLDLDCTEADFREFRETYDYRHPHTADQLRKAFLAIFSSTRGWKKFRGSGCLAASVVEDRIEEAESAVERTAEEEPAAAPRALGAPGERRLRARQRSIERREVRSVLEKLEVEGVDPGKSLRDQSFRDIKMSEGEPAPEFFAKVHYKRSR